MKIQKEWRSFGGRQLLAEHRSAATDTSMEFSVYLPPEAENDPVPAVFYLSGLTCSWANATTKGCFARTAAARGIAVICPDTSPRGVNVADDPAYDLGQGASFYVDATEQPWAKHYRMYTYIVEELPALLASEFPIDRSRLGLMGHSMGGHGALTLGLRHPEQFKSLSALAPVVAPSRVPWGQKAFSTYLGPDRSRWGQYDACELIAGGRHPNAILIDQGDADEYLDKQLCTNLFEEAARQADQSLRLRMQPGYDHSYYFIATFMEDHIHHHATLLGCR